MFETLPRQPHEPYSQNPSGRSHVLQCRAPTRRETFVSTCSLPRRHISLLCIVLVLHLLATSSPCLSLDAPSLAKYQVSITQMSSIPGNCFYHIKVGNLLWHICAKVLRRNIWSQFFYNSLTPSCASESSVNLKITDTFDPIDSSSYDKTRSPDNFLRGLSRKRYVRQVWWWNSHRARPV